MPAPPSGKKSLLIVTNDSEVFLSKKLESAGDLFGGRVTEIKNFVKSMEDELVNDIAESAIGAMFQALEKLREIGIERHSTACPVAEMTMDGVDVQVQVMITPNKLDWLEENEKAVRKVFPFGDTMIN